MLEKDKSVYALMKAANWGTGTLFLSIAIPATLVAIYMISDSGSKIDWTDKGQLLIMISTALAAYGAIWIFVYQWVARSKA